ncbi:site-specific integrase [Listeria booriae]|uniref:site-specific integrase n=1 Tax=Listeria booriae TaxID=1552123 RepID=UPI001C8BEAAD|nr:site-specific integrase [Listeria booriae]
MDFWTVEEFKCFISLFDESEHNYKVFFYTLYFTGMRLGEILGLTWKDINFISSEINVSKTFSIHKGEVSITSPKTKYSNRRISINKSLTHELELWKVEQNNLLKSYLLEQKEDTQVFQFNHTYTHKDIIYKQFHKILTREQTLKKIRIHDFRHSHVALLIHNDEDYTVIKERLGHASITTTIDIYGHLFPSKQKSIADKLDNFF